MTDEFLPEGRTKQEWPTPTPAGVALPAEETTPGGLLRPRSKRFGPRVREAGLGYALVLPSLVIFGLFVFWPFLRNVYVGFYRSPISGDGLGRYVGLDQYIKVLTGQQFIDSLVVTGKFWLLTVPASILLGLLLAMLGHRKLRGMGVYRTLFIVSLATGAGVAGTIFGTLLNPSYGTLRNFPLYPTPPPLDNETWALPVVSILVIWLNVGLAFIVISAGLQNIPEDLYEAARVDGAGPLRIFFRVTVPMLSPTLLFVFVVGSIFALIQSYAPVNTTTQGGPRGLTTTLPYLLVSERDKNPGKAAVLSVALFVIALVFTLIQLFVLERRVTYGQGEKG